MPPLLAALLMMEFDCDVRIIQAIDLGVEWRRCDVPRKCLPEIAKPLSDYWYAGHIGISASGVYLIGTYTWPHPNNHLRY